MASNAITIRIKDFLQQYPPFSYLTDRDLLMLSEEVLVQYYQTTDYIFNQDEENKGYLYILCKGRVELIKSENGVHRIIDICEEGDMFGLKSMITQNEYVSSAKASSDALVYAIPRAVFMELKAAYQKVSLFIDAGFNSGHSILQYNLKSTQEARKNLMMQEQNTRDLFSDEDALFLNPIESVAHCTLTTTVKEAAQQMKAQRVGSLVVLNEQRHPLGIVTDSDFTTKVIAGDFSVNDPISEIMTSPVATLPPGTTVAEFVIASMKKGVRRIVVTQDGTPNTPMVGILSERDVFYMYGNNPAILIKQLLKAKSIEKLVEIRNRADQLVYNYLEQEVSMAFIGDMITEVNDALIQRAVEFSLEALDKTNIINPNLSFAWLSLGSEGRGEQLLKTDQDNAIVYANPPKGQEETAQKYFLALGEKVVDILVRCGFELCEGNIMARNPKWNHSLDGWKAKMTEWLEDSERESIVRGTIFFDYRCCYGDKDLVHEMSNYLFEQIDSERSNFYYYFAIEAVNNPPPLSFFKNFIVENSGKNKDLFDIKKRAMYPLANAARILSIADKVEGVNNTFERYEKLAEFHPKQKEVFEEASLAYAIFMRHRALQGFKHGTSGRFIQPKDLNKIERQTLRTAFKSIEAVQKHLKERFNLSYIG